VCLCLSVYVCVGGGWAKAGVRSACQEILLEKVDRRRHPGRGAPLNRGRLSRALILYASKRSTVVVVSDFRADLPSKQARQHTQRCTQQRTHTVHHHHAVTPTLCLISPHAGWGILVLCRSKTQAHTRNPSGLDITHVFRRERPITCTYLSEAALNKHKHRTHAHTHTIDRSITHRPVSDLRSVPALACRLLLLKPFSMRGNRLTPLDPHFPPHPHLHEHTQWDDRPVVQVDPTIVVTATSPPPPPTPLGRRRLPPHPTRSTRVPPHAPPLCLLLSAAGLSPGGSGRQGGVRRRGLQGLQQQQQQLRASVRVCAGICCVAAIN
jgi:hypothetical protein